MSSRECQDYVVRGRAEVVGIAPRALGRLCTWWRGIAWTPRGAMLAVALAHAVVFLGLFKLRFHVTGMGYYELGSDTHHVYWPAVQKLLVGQVPYVDPRFFVEYPPLGTAFFVLPALLHPPTLRVYDWLFALEVLAVDVATLPLVARLARRQGVAAVGAVAAYGLLVPLLGALVSQRYDLVPAALTLGAALALLDRRFVLAWALLLVATLMKLYPAALAPLFILYEWIPPRHSSLDKLRVRRYLGVALYAVGLVGSTVAWYLLAPASLARFAAWETRRGIEIESLWGSVTELVHLAVGLPAHRVDSYGSYDVVSSLSPALKLLSTVVTLGLLAAVYLSYARRVSLLPDPLSLMAGEGEISRRVLPPRPSPPRPLRERGRGGEGDARLLVTHATLAVLAVLLGSKLLSIQFLLWVLPWLAVQPHRPRRVRALALGIVLLSQWIYPMHWHDLWSFKPGLVLQLALRNVLLAAAFAVLWRERDKGEGSMRGEDAEVEVEVGVGVDARVPRMAGVVP